MVASRPPFQLSYNFSLNHLEDFSASPHDLYLQGLELFESGACQNCIPTLRKSALKFKEATLLCPTFGEAWHAWGCALLLIATITERKDELYEALEKIEKALTCAPQALLSEIHWDAALVVQRLADYSGEVDDLFKAAHHFEKSGDSSFYEFWNAYGAIYATLSERLDDISPVLKSISCYKKGLQLSLSNVEGWLGLGRSVQNLYRYSHENEHFTQACDCLAAASQLKPGSPAIWLERIAFFIESAIRKKECAKLRVAIEKCEQASKIFSSEHLQGYWAAALALLGAWTHRIELIQEAEAKIEAALDSTDVEDPLLIFLYGKCLYSLARYHNDLDLYYQAIEQFQISISIDRTQLACWTWMGLTYSEVYEISDDIADVEKALYFYSKSLQIKNDPHLYYEVAALLIQLGDASEAPESITQAITYLEYLFTTYKSITFDHPEWFYQYGLALNILGDLNDDSSLLHKSLDAFVSVLMFNPTHPTIHHRIAIVYSHLGDNHEDVDYIYRSLHHFKLATRTQVEDETLLIDWGLALLCLSQYTSDESIYREAEAKFMQAARLGSQHVFYHLACLYSLQGSHDLSIAYLQRSRSSKNLPPLEEILDDEWLDSVRPSPQFQEFLSLLR